MRYLTSAHVCAVAGIADHTLDRWAAHGWVEPANNRTGSGRYRLYSVVEAAAVAYGVAVRDAGCSHEWVREAVRFVAGLTPRQLEEAFAEGQTLVLPLPAHLGQTRLTAPKPLPLDAAPQQRRNHELLDLERCFRRVKREAAQLRPGRTSRPRHAL